MHHSDVAIVGGGILGIAHAIEALRRGRTVVLFERDAKASGASVRNFGTIWPIGIPRGRQLDRAMAGRARWIEMADEASFWLEPAGSLHLAHHDDELQVLREFQSREAEHRGQLQMLEPSAAKAMSPGINMRELRGALFCGTELRVDPRQAIAALTGWIAAHENADVRLGTGVQRVEFPMLETTDGARWHADRVIVCSGDDFQTLYPEVFSERDLTKCKLQMMRTTPQPASWRLGPTLAAGLTLIHYASFAACPSLPELRARLEREYPEYLEWGIHVLAAQDETGEVTIGDSHEYGTEFDGTLHAEINQRILDYLGRMIDLPDETIAEGWHGIYAKKTTGDGAFVASPEEGVTIVTCGGGVGMTMSFGLAEEVWNALETGEMITE